MSDPNTTTPRKAIRARNPSRHKPGDGSLPATPAKNLSAQDDFRQGGNSETQGSDSQTPARRSRKTPATNKPHRQPTASIPIASVDGAAHISMTPKKASGYSTNNHQSKTMTPMKQAYAGPTFHASPAPSSLPIPKFFSKSVPAGTSQTACQTHLGASPVGQSMPPSPGPDYDSSDFQPPLKREESPLDLFFNAHRAEQARQKAVHLSQTLSPTPRSSSAQASHGSPQRTDAKDGQVTPQAQLHSVQQPTGKEMFMMELDGTDDQHSAAEAFSPTSFRERVNAVRSTADLSNTPRATTDEQDRLAKTLALKQLLKGMPATPPGQRSGGRLHERGGQPYTNGVPDYGNSPSHASQIEPYHNVEGDARALHWANSPNGHTPLASPHRAYVAQGMPKHNTNQYPSQAPDVKSMEADLRRILKLDQRT